MAALMVCRGSSGNFRRFSKSIACQSPHITYCRRKHTQVIQNKYFNDSLLLSDRISSSYTSRHFCEQSSSPKRPNDEHDAINTETASQSDEKTEDEKKKAAYWAKWKKRLPIMFVVLLTANGTILVYDWGKPLEDEEGRPIEDEYSKYNPVYQHLMRTYREIFFQVKITQEPSRHKLLPDPLTYPYIQPPYTLVIELTDVLVHPEWTYKTGWRFKKRPGIDYFLRAVGPPTFEVVIFTKESGMTADPIITKIDPENFVMYRLYRDATRYQDGEHIKDLNCLNRDLSRVIMIDWNKGAYSLNSENGLSMKKWTGEMTDTVLGELAEFLRAIAASNVDDVRPVLKYYSQFDDPMAKFHENQIKLKEEQERLVLVQQSKEQRSLTGLWSRLMR